MNKKINCLTFAHCPFGALWALFIEMTDLRPSDRAQLLLSGGDLLPRQRARDQAADLVGMELKRDVRSVIDRIVQLRDSL